MKAERGKKRKRNEKKRRRKNFKRGGSGRIKWVTRRVLGARICNEQYHI